MGEQSWEAELAEERLNVRLERVTSQITKGPIFCARELDFSIQWHIIGITF